MAAIPSSVPLLYSRCSSFYFPLFRLKFNSRSFSSSSSSSSSSSLSSSSSSSHFCSSFGSCSSSGVNNNWRNQIFKACAMSTAIGNSESSISVANRENEPDHLLVLVHGIMGGSVLRGICGEEIVLGPRLLVSCGNKLVIESFLCN